MEAKELQNGAKMEPQGTKWRENGIPSEPKWDNKSKKKWKPWVGCQGARKWNENGAHGDPNGQKMEFQPSQKGIKNL